MDILIILLFLSVPVLLQYQLLKELNDIDNTDMKRKLEETHKKSFESHKKFIQAYKEYYERGYDDK